MVLEAVFSIACTSTESALPEWDRLSMFGIPDMFGPVVSFGPNFDSGIHWTLTTVSDNFLRIRQL